MAISGDLREIDDIGTILGREGRGLIKNLDSLGSAIDLATAVAFRRKNPL
jgi:hypothetical protein